MVTMNQMGQFEILRLKSGRLSMYHILARICECPLYSFPAQKTTMEHPEKTPQNTRGTVVPNFPTIDWLQKVPICLNPTEVVFLDEDGGKKILLLG